MIFELFSVIGISYKKSNTEVRSKFGLTPNQIEDIYKKSSLEHILILSTCNRTEVYSFDTPREQLVDILCKDERELFEQECYFIQGRKGFEHFIKVTSGIDSQLLGDYEIAGQMKDALLLSHKYGKSNGYFHKITNFGQSISKTIRTQTGISKGSVSVSKAASDWIRVNVDEVNKKSILVIGAGKMGTSTMKHILEEVNPSQVTLINRTDSITDKWVEELKVEKGKYDKLQELVQNSDIIIVATNSDEYLINDVEGEKTLLDLSIPKNINPKVGESIGVKLVDVDGLSKVKDETLKMREEELTKAEEIIEERLDKFEEQINQGLKFLKKYYERNEL
jgi:glutamyl-tRNA reductase